MELVFWKYLIVYVVFCLKIELYSIVFVFCMGVMVLVKVCFMNVVNWWLVSCLSFKGFLNWLIWRLWIMGKLVSLKNIDVKWMCFVEKLYCEKKLMLLCSLVEVIRCVWWNLIVFLIGLNVDLILLLRLKIVNLFLICLLSIRWKLCFLVLNLNLLF